MPIISTIGRRDPKTRALIALIYGALLLGAVTMIYPFALMISGSTKSAVDATDSPIVPAFLRNDDALFRKHVEGFCNESLNMFRMVFDSDAVSFDQVTAPRPNPAAAVVWTEFLASAPPPGFMFELSYLYAPVSRGVMPSNLRKFRRTMFDRYGGDLARMNREMGTTFDDWGAFHQLPAPPLARFNMPPDIPMQNAFEEFKSRAAPRDRFYCNIENFYKQQYLMTQYGRNIADYNATHGTAFVSWKDVHMPERYPSSPKAGEQERADWEAFVRTVLNLRWIHADAESAPLYRAFLLAKYGSLQALNRNHGTAYDNFEAVPPVQGGAARGLALSDWDSFIRGWKDPDSGAMHRMPVSMLRLVTVESLYRDYARRRFQSIEALNKATGAAYSDWASVLPPQGDFLAAAFVPSKAELKREFLTRNFVAVFDYLVLRGRAILNTVIYCVLAVLASLIVNPLAAYALSRYRPPSTYKVLLFLMLTMAFPPMVTQIPAFLLLKKLNLLNTYWALILPGLANGYSIFLLKGFFDSLPRELYESAALDGAGEFRIFWQITMSLSKPILAVISLNAFVHAYSNFMMALLICQDPAMWTLMPWLYQFQQRSGQGVIFASLLVAAIPTLLVFSFSQKIIMRGIVVPVER